MSMTDEVLKSNKTLWELKSAMEAKLKEPKYVRLLEQSDEHTSNLAVLYCILDQLTKENMKIYERIIKVERHSGMIL